MNEIQDTRRNREIGERVRLLRKARGDTQAALAEVLGMRQPNYLKLEKGRTAWSVAHLSRLARYFGVQEQDLIPCGEVDTRVEGAA